MNRIKLLAAAALLLSQTAYAAVISCPPASSRAEVFGLSSDTKPTFSTNCAVFIETDTDKRYVWTGSAWVRVPADVVATPVPFEVEEIGASATDQTMGATGAIGDYLEGCMMTVVTAATATFGIEDGTNTAFDNITVVVGAATLVAGQPIWIPVGASATTAAGWEITTGAGATAYCRGDFT